MQSKTRTESWQYQRQSKRRQLQCGPLESGVIAQGQESKQIREESEGEKGRQAVAGGMQKRYTWTICQSIWEPNSYIENLTANAGVPER